jgi:hypothetical protein
VAARWRVNSRIHSGWQACVQCPAGARPVVTVTATVAVIMTRMSVIMIKFSCQAKVQVQAAGKGQPELAFDSELGYSEVLS